MLPVNAKNFKCGLAVSHLQSAGFASARDDVFDLARFSRNCSDRIAAAFVVFTGPVHVDFHAARDLYRCWFFPGHFFPPLDVKQRKSFRCTFQCLACLLPKAIVAFDIYQLFVEPRRLRSGAQCMIFVHTHRLKTMAAAQYPRVWCASPTSAIRLFGYRIPIYS